MVMKVVNGPYLGCLLFMMVAIIELGGASRLMTQLPNNHTVKTIKSEDGDVIDCVNIYQQPAFDHPLLKDHILKMTPSNHPQGQFEAIGKEKQITQLWQLSGDCPEGTIPIRRTEKQKTAITKKPTNIFPSRFPSPLADTLNLHEHAVTQSGEGEYYGAKASISAWNPSVEANIEFSLSQFWLLGGSGPSLNSIEAGSTVYPSLFGDRRARLFVYWTTNGYQSTGCYNLLCPGFVQTSNQIAIGASIHTSGSKPEISLAVWKDEKLSAWWLQFNGITVGYWPTSIFTVLKNSASGVLWGGEIINTSPNGRHTATQMGSGRFAEEGFRKASYFRNLEVVNTAHVFVPPPSHLRPFATKPHCYDIVYKINKQWGHFFYYGGPGRNPKCP